MNLTSSASKTEGLIPPAIGSELFIPEHDSSGCRKDVVIVARVESCMMTKNSNERDYLISFVGINVRFYWRALSSQQEELRTKLEGPARTEVLNGGGQVLTQGA